MVVVRNTVDGQSAMGRILVFDNLGPTLVVSDITIDCTQDATLLANAAVTAVDNCTPSADITIRVVAEQVSAVGCTGSVAQTITRTLRATDANGNVSATATQVITINRVPLVNVELPANVTLLSSQTGLCPDEMLALVPATGVTFLRSTARRQL